MLDLSLIKTHLNIEQDYEQEDEYLKFIASVAENAVRNELDMVDEAGYYGEDGEYKPEIKHAMLLMIGTLYANRESEVFATPHELGHSYTYLNMLNKDYSYREDKRTKNNCGQ